MRTYTDIADMAKLTRKALKEHFAGQKFSVRIKRFTGGSSLRVAWTDGPTEDQVKAIVTPIFASDDSRANYHYHWDYWTGSHYYHVVRSYSPERIREVAEYVTTHYADFSGNFTPEYQVTEYESSGMLVCKSYHFYVEVHRILAAQEA